MPLDDKSQQTLDSKNTKLEQVISIDPYLQQVKLTKSSG